MEKQNFTSAESLNNGGNSTEKKEYKYLDEDNYKSIEGVNFTGDGVGVLYEGPQEEYIALKK
ncbi:hypothetical protein ACYSNX_08325 [Myroides sp. LJL115]